MTLKGQEKETREHCLPISLGVVIVRDWEIKDSLELFCLPPKSEPSKGSFNHRNTHKMYAKVNSDGVKKLYKTLENNDVELPARPPGEVLEEFQRLLEENNTTKLLYYGDDHLSQQTWFYGFNHSLEEFSLLDTRPYWREKQRRGGVEKHKMEVIVRDWGDTAIQNRYKGDSHSALTDKWCLARLCLSQPDFLQWMEDPSSVSPGPRSSVVRYMPG